MPDINLEYIKNGSMSSFINQSVDDFSEQQIKEEADFDSTSIQTNEEDGYEQIMIHKGAIGFGKSSQYYNQPSFHQEGRTFCQRVFPYLARDTDLNGDELHAFHTIKA